MTLKLRPKIFIFFFFLITGLVWGAWFFIQSDFSTMMIKKYVLSKIKFNDFNIDYRKVKLKFPFKTSLSDLSLGFKNGDQLIKLKSNEVDFEFELLSLFTNQVRVKVITLNVVRLEITKIGSSDLVASDVKFNVSELSNVLSRYIETIPFDIRSIRLNQLSLLYDKEDHALDIMIEQEKNKFKGLIKDVVHSSVIKKYIDRFELNFLWDENHIKIERAQVFKGESVVEFNGIIFGSHKLSLSGNYYSSDGKVLDIFDHEIKSIFNKLEFDVIGKFSLDYDNGNVISNHDVSLMDFDCDFFEAESLSAKVSIKDGIISASELLVKEGDVVVASSHETSNIFDYREGKIMSSKARLDVKAISLQKALRVLDENRKMIHGKVGGSVELAWDEKGLMIQGLSDLLVHNFQLKDDQSNILSIKNLTLKDLNIDIEEKTTIATKVFMPSSEIDINSTILGKNYKFEFKNGLIDFNDIDDLLGMDFSGKGNLDLVIENSTEPVLKAHFTGPSLSFLNLHFPNANADLSYFFLQRKLTLNNISALYELGELKGSGYIDVNQNKESLINLNFYNLKLDDFVSSIGVINKGQSRFAVQLMNIMTTGQISLNLDVFEGQFKIKSRFTSPKGLVLGEELSQIQGELEINNRNISLNSFQSNLAGGKLKVSGLLGINNDFFEYAVAASDINLSKTVALRKAGARIGGEVEFRSSGYGKRDNFSTTSQFKSNDLKVGKKTYKDNIVDIYNLGDEVFITIDLLSSQLVLNSYLNLNKDSKSKSFVESSVHLTDLKEMLSIFNERFYESNIVDSNIDLKCDADFEYGDLSSLNMNLTLNDFKINGEVGDMYLLNPGPHTLMISNGKILDFKTSIVGDDLFYQFFAKGDLGNSFDIGVDVKVSPRYLRYLLPETIKGAYGLLEGRIRYFGNLYSSSIFGNLKGSDISLKFDNPSYNVERLSFSSILDNDNLFINELLARKNDGTIEIKGSVGNFLSVPSVNLKGRVRNYQANVFKNSYLILDSDVMLSGDFPLSLSGELKIRGGSIEAQLADFLEENEVQKRDTSYLPKFLKNKEINILNIDLDYEIFDPIKISNSLMRLRLNGKGGFKGTLHDIIPHGLVEIQPGVSYFVFKQKEVQIQDGKIRFDDSKTGQLDPFVRIVGTTQLSDYKVNILIDGTVSNLKTELSSTPYLSKEDILSLLAIGMTQEQSKVLTENERESLTSVGIGSIIADHLRLGKELNDMFGLRFAVLPEVIEENSSYLNEYSEIETQRRLRSTTKIQLKKKISDKIDVSFSSTVGGSSTPEQEMNLNYNIKRDIKLEGIYERRSTKEDQENPGSIGLDFKYIFEFE